MPFDAFPCAPADEGAPAARPAACLPILTFHAIEEGRSPLAFPPRLFAELLALLARHGHRTLSLAQACAALAGGAGFPPRALVVTFDDGYRSVFDEAYPRLRDHGCSATLFLATGEDPGADGRQRLPSLCGREMLSWDEADQLAGAGWEIGAHTLSHPDLTRVPAGQARREIGESKRRLEQRLGVEVTAFAYPYGRVDGSTRDHVAHEYQCACGVALGLWDGKSDAFLLPRLDMYYLRARRLLPLLFSPWLRPYLCLRGVPRMLRARLAGGPGR